MTAWSYITTELRFDWNTAKQYERLIASPVLEEKFDCPAHNVWTTLPKLNGLKIEPNDAFFLCPYFILFEIALVKLLLCQFG